MPTLENLIAQIQLKVNQLAQRNSQLRKQVVEQQAVIDQLQTQINQNNILINNLKEQNNTITPRNTTKSKCHSAEIEKQIDQLINTIDESLALLEQSDK